MCKGIPFFTVFAFHESAFSIQCWKNTSSTEMHWKNSFIYRALMLVEVRDSSTGSFVLSRSCHHSPGRRPCLKVPVEGKKGQCIGIWDTPCSRQSQILPRHSGFRLESDFTSVGFESVGIRFVNVGFSTQTFAAMIEDHNISEHHLRFTWCCKWSTSVDQPTLWCLSLARFPACPALSVPVSCKLTWEMIN